MRIFDLVTANAIAAYWTETNSNRIPYLGEALFPSDKKLGLKLSWIKGYRGLPIALKPSAFDAKAEIRDRIGVKRIETEMPFFRESMKIKEEDRQQLLMLQEASPQYYNIILKELFDDRANLIEGGLVQSERMRMQLLVGGKIRISAAGMNYDYNFDETGEYAANNTLTLTGNDRWSDHANSRPIQDLQKAIEFLTTKHGSRPVRMVMSPSDWANLLQNQSIKMDMHVDRGQHIILTETMLEQYILTKLKLKVVVYDKKYKDEAGLAHPFYPEGHVSLLPGTTLGKTWYGTTPEEADLMSGSDAKVEIVEKGIAVTTVKEPHPVNVDTIVSEIVMPSFERMDETFLLKVA